MLILGTETMAKGCAKADPYKAFPHELPSPLYGSALAHPNNVMIVTSVTLTRPYPIYEM